MSVYNKELIIDGEAVLSPEQQIYKNAKDIKTLKQYIKEAYKCTGELNTASISVAKSLTNAGESVKEGWLLDTVGNLFKITGGDEDNLLIDFYSCIAGPEGQPGAALEIDDSSTSASKVWSSQKTNTEVNSAKTMSTVYMTTATPTYDSGDDSYTFNISDINDMPTNNTILGKEIVQIVDSKVKYIYGIRAYTSTTIECELLGEVGGKALYLHNVKYSYGAWYVCISFISSDNTEIDTMAKLSTWLSSNGFTSTTRFYPCGGYHASDQNKDIIGINAASPTATPYVTYRDNTYYALSGNAEDSVHPI